MNVSAQAGAHPAKVEVLTLSPPAAEWLKPLRELYSLWDAPHARGEWASDLERRLLGRAGRSSQDRFYIVPCGRQVASAMDVSRSVNFAGLAAVHRVFTHPAARRRGYAQALFEAAKRDFAACGGRILLAVVPEKGSTREFYSAQGFSEVVRARDGTALLGWAARGRRVREALLHFLRQPPSRFRQVQPGDWAALIAWASLEGGRPDAQPETIPDGEWLGILDTAGLEVGESRHGYIVAVRRYPSSSGGDLPAWLERLLG